LTIKSKYYVNYKNNFTLHAPSYATFGFDVNHRKLATSKVLSPLLQALIILLLLKQRNLRTKALRNVVDHSIGLGAVNLAFSFIWKIRVPGFPKET
jgi:hypothetical protein